MLFRSEALRIDALEKKITDMLDSSPALQGFSQQIRLEKTGDGLKIQILDEQNRPMFDVGSALVKPYMRDILRAIGSAMSDVENRIALSGHTDATPFGTGERGYSNWELSSDRANASRRELVAGGLPDARLLRVEGLASSRLLDPESPNGAINRRISILVLTREAEQRLLPTEAPTKLSLTEGETQPPDATGPASATQPGLQNPPEVTKLPVRAGG